MKKILVTDASSYKAIVVARALSFCDGIQVFGTDSRSITARIHSRWFSKVLSIRSTGAGQVEFCAAIYRVCEENQIERVVPVNSAEMRALLPNKAELGSLLDEWGSYESFVALDNKARLHELADSLGVRVPRQGNTLESLSHLLPVVLKPSEASSSKGVRYIDALSEISDFDLERLRDRRLVAQERIFGRGVGLSVLARAGKVVAHCGHLRIAEWPSSGGSSTIREFYESDQALAYAEKLIAATNWSGLAMFEFKLSDNGELVLIECNPRVWGSIGQSISTGVNFPALLLGLPDSRERMDKRAVTKLSPMCWASIAAYAIQGRTREFRSALAAVVKAEADVSMLKDPFGYLSMLARPIGGSS